MKQWKLAGLVVALMLIGMRTASAVPVVNGTITGSEWDTYLLGGGDPNEGTITDNWDIASARMFQEDSGGGSDGWYFLMTTYAAPTFSPGPGGAVDQAFFQFSFDYDGDGLINSASDRVIDFNRLSTGVVEVRNGLGVSLGFGVGALGSVVELSAAEALFPAGTPQAFARLDGQGQEPDDFIPDQGFFTPVPEPTSMLLFGVGLLGGLARKKLSLF